MIRIQNIRMPLDYTEETLHYAAAKKLQIPVKSILSLKVRRRSVDARKRGQVSFLFSLDLTVKQEAELLKKFTKDNDIAFVQDIPYAIPSCRRF